MKINALNRSVPFLALATALVISMGLSRAQTLAFTDFSTATPSPDSGLNAWSTDAIYGHLSFGSGGAVSTGGYYDTTASLTTAATLSSSPLWVDIRLTLNSTTASNTAFTSSFNFTDGSNITVGSKPSTGSVDWNTFYTSPSYAGVYGSSTTVPTDPTDYLAEITTTGSTITVQAWAFDDNLGGLPSTDPTGDSTGAGAVNYGTFSFDSSATALSSVELGGQGLVGNYSSLAISNSYAGILDPAAVPEPSSLCLLTAGALGLFGFAARRKFCR